MLNPSFTKFYLVTFYNKTVRALVKDNQTHPTYEDHWGTAHTQDVAAMTESEARSKLLQRFPAQEGFVIERVTPEPL
ncbi:MAG: hypothetical protein JKY92_07595 [Magnetovibrio sp.]|nr:hypothetical protein [Magnetovibrio sp.]